MSTDETRPYIEELTDGGILRFPLGNGSDVLVAAEAVWVDEHGSAEPRLLADDVAASLTEALAARAHLRAWRAPQ